MKVITPIARAVLVADALVQNGFTHPLLEHGKDAEKFLAWFSLPDDLEDHPVKHGKLEGVTCRACRLDRHGLVDRVALEACAARHGRTRFRFATFRVAVARDLRYRIEEALPGIAKTASVQTGYIGELKSRTQEKQDQYREYDAAVRRLMPGVQFRAITSDSGPVGIRLELEILSRDPIEIVKRLAEIKLAAERPDDLTEVGQD